MTKITVQRALTELKNVSDRLDTNIGSLQYTKAHQVGKNIGPQTPEQFTKVAKESMQSITDLIKRASNLKAAIHLSNMSTKVTVAGKEMTVLEAIVKKETVKHELTLVNLLKQQVDRETRILDNKNEEIQRRAEELAKTYLGSDSNTTNSEKSKAISDDYLKSNEWVMVNGNEALTFVTKMQNEIQDFLMDVDATLSESNAITYIEVA
jgi:hypothetical protein